MIRLQLILIAVLCPSAALLLMLIHGGLKPSYQFLASLCLFGLGALWVMALGALGWRDETEGTSDG